MPNKLMPLQGYTVVTGYNTFTTYALTSYGIVQQAQKIINFPKFELNYYMYCDSWDPTDEPVDPIEMHYEGDIAKKFLSGDFNGDGITDVVAIDQEVYYPYQDDCHYPETYQTYPGGNLHFINLDQRIPAPPLSYSAGAIYITNSTKYEIADFNGDGKSDLYVFNPGYVRIYTMNDSETFELLYENSSYDSNIASDKPALFGDYNGDGKSDFIIPNSTGSSIWHKYSSTGTVLVKESQTYSGINFQANTSIYNYSVIPTDYNNDGKTDLLYTASSRGAGYNVGSLDVTCYINRNGVFSNSGGNYYSASIKDKPEIYANAMPIFLNPNQRNQKLELAFINSNKIFYFKSNKDFNKEQLLNSITDGNGVVENIYYKPLIEQSYDEIGQVYSNSNFTENYPNMDISGVPTFQVVSKLEKISATSYKKQLFSYYGAVSNVEGLGFLGFRGILSTNWFDGTTTNMLSSVSRNDISLRGVPIENYTVLGAALAQQSAPSSFISKSIFNYSSVLLPNKVYEIKTNSKQEFNGLDGTNSEIVYNYDGYNNPIQTILNVKEGGSTVQTTTTNYSYDDQPTASTYYIGRPISKNTSITGSGDTMTSEELYRYTNHLLTQVKKKGHNTNYITEDNVYDAYGNITKKTITASGLTPRETNYEYDSSGRFLTKSTDIEGLATVFAYNANNGTLLSETNPYGLTTSYTYDSWFKKINATDYLGKNMAVTYTRSGGDYLIGTNGDDGSATEEIFDDLGRKTQSGVKDISGNFSYISYLYDIYDRKVKVSEPFSGGSPSQWNETQYDDYGRITQNIAFTGKTTSISYSGLTVTASDGVKTKTSTKNAMGNVVSMTDSPGGTIAYTYFANGNLKSTNYDGVTTTIEQDGWGRKIKLIDPSAGIYTYTYNDLGEALTETTPNGTTTYTLNGQGKPTQKTIVGTNTNSSTTYTYDGGTKLLTGCTFVDILENSATITTSYTYDSSKRLSSTSETTPYASFSKQLTYDGFGRLNTETLTASTAGKSSGKTIQHTYQNGQSWQIIDPSFSQVLWQTNSVNARGQLTGATMANGNIGLANTYDSYGFITQTKQDRLIASPGNIYTFNTAFDAQRGNLTSRTNSLFNWSESFTYDSLDRLTSFKNTAGVTETQSYDDRGRITQNAVGTYNYTNNSAVYQNTSVTLTPNVLSYYQTNHEQNVTYNAFKSPYQIEEVGKDKINFTYNDGNDRSTMFYGSLNNDKLLRPYRKYYSADGSMEIKHNIQTGAIEFVTYIGGDAYSAPLVLKSDGTTQNYLYLQRDYQGSIIAITDASGYVLEKRLFDAWGNVLVQDGAGNTLNGLTILDRGYTGHEHLQTVGLINMNGRIYDPKLHRFLQPDNNVQDPFNTQNYNRYGYVLNNPLKYTDPSGEFWNIVIGAVIGGVVNWATHGCQFNTTGLAYFGVGAVAGALTAMGAGGVSSALAGGSFSAGALGTAAACSVGSGFASGAVVGAAGGLAGGFTSGFGNGLVEGKNIGDCFKNGIKDGALGAITGGVIGGIAGGIDAALDGRNFWSGKGQSIDAVKVPANTVCSDEYTSNVEMRADYNNNIGSRDGLSLEQVEKKLNTSVALGGNGNLPSGWNLDANGGLTDGSTTAAGITVRSYSGGIANKMSSNIFMSPSVKGYDLNIRNMLFKHEFMHAWHMSSGFGGYNTYSERATSSFSVAYCNAYGYGFMSSTWRSDIGSYPAQFNWTKFNKIIPLWIK